MAGPTKASKILKIVRGDALDIATHRLYIEPSPNAVTYASQMFELGSADEIDLSTIAGMEDIDGVFNLGVTSVDDAGNESTSMTKLNDVPLDFVPPDPPKQISIV